MTRRPQLTEAQQEASDQQDQIDLQNYLNSLTPEQKAEADKTARDYTLGRLSEEKQEAYEVAYFDSSQPGVFLHLEAVREELIDEYARDVMPEKDRSDFENALKYSKELQDLVWISGKLVQEARTKGWIENEVKRNKEKKEGDLPPRS